MYHNMKTFSLGLMGYEKPAADGSSKTEMAASLRKVLALPFKKGKRDKVITTMLHLLANCRWIIFNNFVSPFQRLEYISTKWTETSSGRASTPVGTGWTESLYVEKTDHIAQ